MSTLGIFRFYAVYPIANPTEITTTDTIQVANGVFNIYFHSNQPVRLVRVSDQRTMILREFSNA